MAGDRIEYLLHRFFNQDYTPEEKQELALWIDTLQNDEEWKLYLKKLWNSYTSASAEDANENEPAEKMDVVKA